MVKENAGYPPSTRTRRNNIAIILSMFCFLSFYTVDESNFLSFISSNESSEKQNRRQLISDNVWEAELQARQLRLAAGGNTKKQRKQIERKRMLEEEFDIWSPTGRPPPERYVSALRIIFSRKLNVS